mgnify:FL=1
MLVLRCKYLHDMYVNDVSEASYVRLMSSDNETTVSNVCTWRFKRTGQFFRGKMLKYFTIICAWVGGLIFRNKLYKYIYVTNLYLRPVGA